MNKLGRILLATLASLLLLGFMALLLYTFLPPLTILVANTFTIALGAIVLFVILYVSVKAFQWIMKG